MSDFNLARSRAIYRTTAARELAKKHGWICWYCRSSLNEYAKRNESKAWELDHIVSRKRGGSNKIHNMALACVQCNRAKAALSLDEFWVWLKRPKFLVQTLTERLGTPESAHVYEDDIANGLRRRG